MKPHLRPRLLLVIGLGASIVTPLASVPASAAPANAYVVHDLVSDGAHPADTIDPNLVNAWGLTAGPTSPWWVADNGTDLSTLYTATGVKIALEVRVGGGPTGAVFNGTTDFMVTNGTASGPALFLFASEDGTIRGWNPGVPPPAPSLEAQVAVDRSNVGAIYKGLAIGSTPSSGPLLYATDFHNGRVDVFDGTFNLVSTPGAFTDPGLPTGYAPFGIQSIGAHCGRSSSATVHTPTARPTRCSSPPVLTTRAMGSSGPSGRRPEAGEVRARRLNDGTSDERHSRCFVRPNTELSRM